MQWEGSRVREGEEAREWGQPLVCEMKKKIQFAFQKKKKKRGVNPFLVLGNKVRGERKKIIGLNVKFSSRSLVSLWLLSQCNQPPMPPYCTLYAVLSYKESKNSTSLSHILGYFLTLMRKLTNTESQTDMPLVNFFSSLQSWLLAINHILSLQGSSYRVFI